MIYGMDTTDETAATGALLIYAIYRSRDLRRYRSTPDMWGQIERFAKDAAKRARSIPQFLEALKPRLSCPTIHPRWLEVGDKGEVPLLVYRDAGSGAISHMIQRPPDLDRREFLAALMERADHKAVLARLYKETAWLVMLVRDRLERERPITADLEEAEGGSDEGDLAHA